MGVFIMMGRYSPEAIQGISSRRTQKARNLVEKEGGKIREIYALLGEKDLLIIAEFPGIEEAVKASVSLTKSTGISFTTLPAIPVERFDEIIEG